MNKCNSGVYQILNVKNSKKYIGSTNNFSRRFSEHRCSLNKGDHENQYLQKAWLKYGPESFIFTILLACEEKDLIMYEQIIMDDTKCYKREFGYNLCEVAGARSGHKMSEEHKEKLRLMSLGNTYFKGKKHTEEAKQKMSDNRIGKQLPREQVEKQRQSLTGYKHTEEARKNMSEAQKNRPPRSPETLAKLSKANKGKTISPEAREKMSLAKKGKAPWNKGKSTPDDVRQKQSISAKNKSEMSDETKTKIGAYWKWHKQSPESVEKRKESFKKNRLEKERIKNQSRMFQAQITLQNDKFNI